MSRGRDKFKKYKSIINIISTTYGLFPLKLRKWLFIQHRNTSGKIGLVIRYCLLKKIAKKVGDNVSIFQGCYILNAEQLEIGNNVSIHPMCYLECLGGLKIGNDVSIAHSASIITASHKFDNIKEKINNQGIELKPIIIEDNVWIGAKATILYGKKIESGSIVGANCLVTKDVHENEIVGGIPNKIIKRR